MFKITKFSTLNSFNNVKHMCLGYSTKPVRKENFSHDEQLQEFERTSNISQKHKTKKPQRPPFVKNFLLGNVDTDLLAYPEITNEEFSSLQQHVTAAKAVVRRPDIKECQALTSTLLHKLARERLLGLQTSQLMGGRELRVTEMCRLTEVLSEVRPKINIVNNENLGISTLIKFGSDKLKKKYLQRLINGECVSAFCLVEPLTNNIDPFKKTATLSADRKTWVLNGQKCSVINGSNADLYVVLASTNVIVKDEINDHKYTGFLIEREFGGITSCKHETVDENLQISDITFQNTPIPAENVIGQEEIGEKILAGVYPEHRLSTGPVCSVLIKKLIDNMIQHFITCSQPPYLLHEADAIQSKMGELAASLYAVDSMVYMTSGLLDNYENQDCELETAIVKVFASEQAFLNTATCLDLVGIDAITDKHWCNMLHKEAMTHVTLNDSNDTLKTIIALFGLQHAGKEVNETVKKLRNPLFHANFILKRMWSNRNQAEDNPKLNLFLHNYLHPSFIPASQRLEYCILRLKYATEVLLGRYGDEVVNKHAELRRLAESIIDIYAMCAAISRASRSYCIGLQHAEYELTLASSLSSSATERVRTNLSKIIDGPYQTNDGNYKFISERLFRFKQYYPVHPLTRNF